MLKYNMIIIYQLKMQSDNKLKISIMLMINNLSIIKSKLTFKELEKKLHIIIIKVKKRHKVKAQYKVFIKFNDIISSVFCYSV